MDLNGPALAPPPGVTPDLDNPPNQNALAWGVLITCVAFATMCFFLRVYGRVFLLRKFQAEEALVTLAYGCFWGAVYSTFAMVKTPGYFVHQWNITLGDLIPTTYWIFIFGVCYSFVLPFLKVAILVEWCRVFVLPGSRMKSLFWWGSVAVIFVQITAGIAIVVSLNLQCVPHQAIWDFTIPGKCWDLYRLQVASATIHLICDVTIFLLPQRLIWTLKMSWRKRLGVSGIFGLGVLAIVSASFRLGVTVTYGRAEDAIYNLGPLVFWATAEMTCGFFIVCVPCIPKILKEAGVLPKIGRSSKSPNTDENLRTFGGSGGKRSKVTDTVATTDEYFKLEEDGDGVSMENMDRSGSAEQLHNGLPGGTVTRTTGSTVTNDYRSAGDAA